MGVCELRCEHPCLFLTPSFCSLKVDVLTLFATYKFGKCSTFRLGDTIRSDSLVGMLAGVLTRSDLFSFSGVESIGG